MPAHPDANAGPIANAATLSDPDACPHADAHCDTDTDAHADPETDTYADTNAEGHTDAEGDSHTNAEGHTDAEGDSHAEGHTRGQPDSIPDTRARYHRHAIARRGSGRDDRRRAAAHGRSRRTP